MLVLAALLAAAPAPCLDVRSGNARLTLDGHLDERSYSGVTPRPERAFILVLNRPICIDDGGQFADPTRRFRRVQLYASNDRLRPRLRAALAAGSGSPARVSRRIPRITTPLWSWT